MHLLEAYVKLVFSNWFLRTFMKNGNSRLELSFLDMLPRRIKGIVIF